ncbi:Protocadherin-15, partial [Branchiostoma belcheri]
MHRAFLWPVCQRRQRRLVALGWLWFYAVLGLSSFSTAQTPEDVREEPRAFGARLAPTALKVHSSTVGDHHAGSLIKPTHPDSGRKRSPRPLETILAISWMTDVPVSIVAFPVPLIFFTSSENSSFDDNGLRGPAPAADLRRHPDTVTDREHLGKDGGLDKANIAFYPPDCPDDNMAGRGLAMVAGESILKSMFVSLGVLFVSVHFAQGQDACNILSTSQLGQSPVEIIESVDETSPQGTLIDTLTFAANSINDLTLEYINHEAGDDASLLNPTSTSIVNGNLQLVLSAAGAVTVQERDGPSGVQQFSLTLKCRVNRNRHEILHPIRVSITDVNDNRPVFQQPYTADVYEVFHPIRVSVSDINDNRPVFIPASPPATSISELQAVGTTVLRAQATDLDIGASGNVQFFVQNNPNDPMADDFFEIPLPAQGYITLRTQVNYEAADNTDHQYLLMVTAEDQGTTQLTATQTFTINILDEDDLPPAFNPCIRDSLSDPCKPVTYTGEVTSGVNSGAVSNVNPEPVNAFDQDRDLQQADQTAIKYSIADGSPSTYSDKFQIHEDTGVVSVRQTINRVDAASYILKIRAYQEDNPFRLATADMTITVNPSGNERPAFDESNYVGYVFENAPTGTTVRGSSSAQTPLKIMLSDPDVLDGSPAVTVEVTTQPAGNDDKFMVTQGSSTREWYVLANGALDAETINQYTLTITARETTGPNPQTSNPSVVTINIQDVNDNTPVFNSGTAGSAANPLTGAVSIPVADGTSVALTPGTPQCSDTDTGSTFTYRIDRVINGVSNLFNINPNTGDITVASGAGLVDGRVYTVVIVCSDGLNERQGYVDITVTGTQNNQPTFPLTQYTTRLGEEAPVNGPVTTVTASDPDGNILTYSLGTGNTDNDFQINQNTGEISVRNTLDYERTPSYTLQVLATDNGSPATTATATVQIDLTNGNDNSPTFTAPANPNQPIEVAEGGQNGDPVQSVQATDPDGAGSGITYSLLRGGDKFAINPTTGQITRRGPLDRDDQREIPVTVQAMDSGGRIALLDLTIQLTDVNNKPPVFQDNEFARRPLSPPNAEYIVNVDENEQAMAIIDLEAADPDVGATVQYSRDSVTPNTGETLFTVNENTGVLSTTGPLDFENVTPPRYTVVILAEDTAQAAPHLSSRTSTATVTVNIQDKNDFPPTFEGTPYSFSVREDVAIGTSIGQLSATDADNPQPQFAYSTYTDPAVQNSDAAAAMFAVDPMTGDVVTRRNLASDYANINQFPLLVRVSDEGPPVMTSTGTVTIEVTERGSANAVSFTQSQYTGTVGENAAAGTIVAFTRGIDISPSRSNVDYTIVSSQTTPPTSADTTGYFRIVRPANLNDPLILETTRALDYEEIRQYLLTVQVAPSGSSGTTGRRKKRQLADNTALVQVDVQDVNDNTPTFDAPTYVTGVSEDANLFSSLVQVRATDRDSSPFNNFVYKIKSQPNGQLSPVARNFTVDSSTGVVRNLVPFRPGQVGKKFFFNVEADEAPAQSGGQTFTGDTSVVCSAPRTGMFGCMWIVFNNREGTFGCMWMVFSTKDRTFQDVSGNYVLIERIDAKKEGNTLDYANCDVYFYMIKNGTFDALTRQEAISVLEGSRTQVDQLWRTCDGVPSTDRARASAVSYRGVQYTGNTSYSGISDLQAALIALGVLLFLLALLALLWLCCCTRIRKRTGYQIPPPYEPPPAPEPVIYEPEKKEYETQEGIATFGHDMAEPAVDKEVVITGEYNKGYEHADEAQVGTLSFPPAHDDVGP